MNAFDVVRRAKYGDSGVGSYKAMEKFALEDAAVKALYEEEQEAGQGLGVFLQKLDVHMPQEKCTLVCSRAGAPDLSRITYGLIYGSGVCF